MVSTHKRAVGVFASRPQTASALQALSDSGFSMGDVSVIAKDGDRQKDIAGVSVTDEVTNQADKGGAVGAVTGGVLGGVTGLLVGLGTLTIPGLGPALLAGEAAAVVATLIGGGAGAVAGGLLGALIGLGIPEHRATRYRDRVEAGGYLVLVKGDDTAIAHATDVLSRAGIDDWGVYPIPDADSAQAAGTHRNRPIDFGSDTPGDRRSMGDRSEGRPGSYGDAHGDRLHTLDRGQLNGESRDRDAGSLVGDRTAAPPRQAAPAAGTDSIGQQERRVVGVFLNQAALEEALAQLQRTGFAMHRLSIAVREANDGVDYGGAGHSLAGATRLAAGLDRIHLPEVGRVTVMGPDADAFAGTFSGDRPGRIGSLGIAPESASLYRRHLTNGAYLVTLRGTNQDLLDAASALGQWGMHDWGIYDVWGDRG